VEVTDENLYADFLRFVKVMDMSFSYKPVWFRTLLEHVDERGRAPVNEVADGFHQFYLDREVAGRTIERPNSKMSRPAELTRSEVQQVINQGPFDRFSRLDFVSYARDRAYYEINQHVWKRLRELPERVNVRRLCEEAQAAYFQGIK
jgi:hypothetical protein